VLAGGSHLPGDGIFLGRAIETADTTAELAAGWIRQCAEGHDHRREVAPKITARLRGRAND
jgi:hypothetical protein